MATSCTFAPGLGATGVKVVTWLADPVLGGFTLPDWIQHVLQGLVIAVAASYVTVRLAIHRFREERWWQRRADAYTAVLDALHRVKRYTSQKLASYYQASQSEGSASDRWKILEAYAEIDKATDLGSLFMSDEAAACLKKFDDDMEQLEDISLQEDFVGYLSTVEEATNGCLKTLRAIAKRDLHVGNGKWWTALGQVVKRLRGH